MRFVKMHGTGNDYIYINLIPGFDDTTRATYNEDGCLLTIEEKKVEDVVIPLSDRHFGIGSDGLIAVAPSDIADVRMIMYNADGSEGSMCGNGIRCVAKFAYDRGLLNESIYDGSSAGTHPVISIETKSGIKKVTLTIENGSCTYVEVNMGRAILVPEDIPADTRFFSNKDQITDYPLAVGEKKYNVTCVSMGNPHCVIFTENIDELDLETIGPLFEHHDAFPEQINTEFIEVIDDHTIKMRVWERGSGETMSCGTGTCAATVAAVLNGYVKADTETEVRIPGGRLYDTYLSSGEVLMKGPAVTVYEGEVD
ncbi:MAG: diaminopimelate epimerase [Eubacterium sp.]|nr:diaminopimelate epimerase [Eubacterium sp.]